MFITALMIVIVNFVPATVQYMDLIGQVPADVVNQFLAQNGMTMDQAQQMLNTLQGQQLAQQVMQGEVSFDQAQNIVQESHNQQNFDTPQKNTQLSVAQNQDTNYQQGNIDNPQINEQQQHTQNQNDLFDQDDVKIENQNVVNENQEIFDTLDNLKQSNQDIQIELNQQGNVENSQIFENSQNNEQQSNDNKNDQSMIDNVQQHKQEDKNFVQHSVQQYNTQSNNNVQYTQSNNNVQYNTDTQENHEKLQEVVQQQNQENDQQVQNNDLQEINLNNDGLKYVTEQQFSQEANVVPENYPQKFEKRSTNIANFLKGIQSPISEESSENALEEMRQNFFAPVFEQNDSEVTFDALLHKEPQIEVVPYSEDITFTSNKSDEVVNAMNTPLDLNFDLEADSYDSDNTTGDFPFGALLLLIFLSYMLYIDVVY